MGLFSSKKIINVSSTLYNMAGDENDRPNFLKGTVFSSVIAGNPSIADDITTSYFNGPGMNQRQFFKYADRNDMSGLPVATVMNSQSLDIPTVAGEIPLSPTPAGLEMSVYSAEVNAGDFEIWIEKWILENHPERNIEDWIGDYEPSTDMFSVEFPNNDFFTWANDTAPVYDKDKRYVVAKYIESLEASEDAVVEGTPTDDVTTLPDVSEWDEVSTTDTFTPVTLQRERTTIYSYNNGDPDETIEDAVDADVSGELNTSVDVYEREVTVAASGIGVEGERQFWTFTGTDDVLNDYEDVVITNTDMGGGVIRTETSTTTGERVNPKWTTQYDTQAIYMGEVVGGEQVFIYEVGTGNTTLDEMVEDLDATDFQEFFPFMPIRINNVSVAHESYSDLYDEMSKAYRRAYQGKSFGDLIEKVEENESIDDIDYAYLVWGASLNVKDMSCRKYIYKFFEIMGGFQPAGSGLEGMQAEIDAYDAAVEALADWQAEVSSTHDEAWDSLPPRPSIPTISPPRTNQIRLNDADLGFDVRLEWVDVQVEQFSGTYNEVTTGSEIPKKDDLEIITGDAFTWTERQTYNTRDGEEIQYVERSIPAMKILWQITEDTYRVMTVYGLTHYNYIYGGKAVVITSTQALEDDEESGFFVPLHYPTMTELGIVDYTQMSTANAHILFNCYTVTKQRWYERGIFKILLVIAIIVIAVIAFPGAFAAGGGILGGNLAVGAALGLTGTAALVAGVVANYIASIIISELLKVVGTALFGEKWGAIFSAIAGFALGAAISGVSMFSAEGIMGLANAVANGYSGWVQGDIAERMEDLEADRNNYEDQMEKINELLAQLGGNDLNFNPMQLTDSGRRGNGRSGGYTPETAEEFIRRTTMTASDLVELTHAMVYDFVAVNNTLPRN